MLTANLPENEYRIVILARPSDDDEHRLPVFVLARLTVPPNHANRLLDQLYTLVVEHTDDLLVEHFPPAVMRGPSLLIRYEQMEADPDLHGLISIKIEPTHADESDLYQLQVVVAEGNDLMEAEYDDELNELAVEVELQYD